MTPLLISLVFISITCSILAVGFLASKKGMPNPLATEHPPTVTSVGERPADPIPPEGSSSTRFFSAFTSMRSIIPVCLGLLAILFLLIVWPYLTARSRHGDLMTTYRQACSTEDVPKLHDVLSKRSSDPYLSKLDLNREVWHAIFSGQKKVVEVLLAHGASLEAVNNEIGETPLLAACGSKKKDIAVFLIQKGANVNAISRGDSLRPTALFTVIENGWADVASLILTKHAHLGTRDAVSDTVLHMAARKNQKEIARLLLLNGADVNARGFLLQTPLHIAARKGFTEFAFLLLNNGAEVNAPDNLGLTPLSDALYRGHGPTIQLLKSYGGKDSVLREKANERLQGTTAKLAESMKVISDGVAARIRQHEEAIRQAEQNLKESVRRVESLKRGNLR